MHAVAAYGGDSIAIQIPDLKKRRCLILIYNEIGPKKNDLSSNQKQRFLLDKSFF
jgi:hypothetical protein